MSDAIRNRLQERLRAFGQEHLLAFWDELDGTSRHRLARQIDALDLPGLDRLSRSAETTDDWHVLARRAAPPRAIRLSAAPRGIGHDRTERWNGHSHQAAAARARGEAILRAGEVGVVIVAGGQGTRLGFDHPKGLLPLGPVSGRSLFRLLFDRIRAVARRYATSVPVFLMTSPATHDETQAYFDENARLGLPADDLQIFSQGTLPALDAETRRILLAERDTLALSPDGHGGLLAALVEHGGLAAAQRRGLRHLFYAQVDNPLAPLCDPELIGFHSLGESELTTLVVAKRHARERVGNVVAVDGRMRIIEYIHLPEEIAEQRNPDGSLRLWAGNMAIHLFDVDFLARMAGSPDSLPVHAALKKTPFVAADGATVRPAAPNAIKFERFIFDLLPNARQALAIEADPAEAFAPVKNANQEGFDSPALAQQAMIRHHREWLGQAGATVAEGVRVEINPLYALDAEELTDRIPPGTHIAKDTYWDERSP